MDISDIPEFIRGVVQELVNLWNAISDCWLSFLILLVLYTVLLYKLFVFVYKKRLEKLEDGEKKLKEKDDLLKELESLDYKIYKASQAEDSRDEPLKEEDWFK